MVLSNLMKLEVDKMKKILILLAIIPLIFAGCVQTEKKKAEMKIEDLAGRGVDVPKNVNRIIALGPGCLRLIVYLNATDKVVGVEDSETLWSPYGRPYRIAHPELAEKPMIGKGGPNFVPNVEKIVELKPDVIFATYIDPHYADNLQEKTEFLS